MITYRYVAAIIALTTGLFLVSSAVNASVPSAGPAPDLVNRAPYDVNTQANTVPLWDGAGRVLYVARASSGPYSGSVIVYWANGTCILCDIDARGAASISEDGGYYWVTSVDEDKRTKRSWWLDERRGVAKRPALTRAATLPSVRR